MIVDSIAELIGDTPLLKIDPAVHGMKNVDLYAKLEYTNPFGSVKDRVAKGMLDPILDELKEKNKTVIEASSGNTAKALSALAGIHGLGFKAVTNRIKMPEVRMILQTLGSEIEELPGLSDCPDPNDPNDFTTVASNLATQQPDVYHYTDQYFNELNRTTHYETTGKEIARDLDQVDYFIGVLGTCGSSMGAGSYLKESKGSDVIGVVADAGYHIPGGRNMNELWEVGFFRKDFYASIESGTTLEAIEGMLELNRQCGMMCGPTTGLTYRAALKRLKQIDAELTDGERKTAVFIACDRMEPYMSYLKQHKPDVFSTSVSTRETVHSLDPDVVRDANVVTVEELAEMEDPIVIDVRSRFAYSLGHIPGSVSIIDELFAQLIEEGPAFPMNKKIVVACRVGSISKKYAAYLSRQGYDAASLFEGVAGWKRAGKELVKSGGATGGAVSR